MTVVEKPKGTKLTIRVPCHCGVLVTVPRPCAQPVCPKCKLKGKCRVLFPDQWSGE